MPDKRLGFAFARTPHGELVLRLVGNAKATTFASPAHCLLWLDDIKKHVEKNYGPKTAEPTAARDSQNAASAGTESVPEL